MEMLILTNNLICAICVNLWLKCIELYYPLSGLCAGVYTE